ncbi:hypothetical protein KR032_003830, partial [Drosophila birchii]
SSALLLCCLAIFVALYAADYVCNPNGNNEPDCNNATNQGVMIRNFFDPTRYWLCNSTNVAASVPCEIKNSNGTVTPRGFMETKCVPWNEYKWTPPC